MIFIVEQSLLLGQQSTVVPPANTLHVEPTEQQKFDGSPDCVHLL